MFLLELSCFYDPTYVGNLLSGSSAFSKSSLNNWKFMVHVLLKPGLENLVYNSCLCEYLTCPQIQYIQNFLSFPPFITQGSTNCIQPTVQTPGLLGTLPSPSPVPLYSIPFHKQLLKPFQFYLPLFHTSFIYHLLPSNSFPASGLILL